MKLKYELYIAASAEAKNIYRKTLPKDGFFNCDALNLSELIDKVQFEKTKIDDVLARIIFQKAITSVIDDLKHFQYSKDTMFENSIDYLYAFYGKIKNNKVTLDDFVQGLKRDDISLIFDAYEKIKTEQALLDSSDIIDLVSADNLNEVLKKYDSIIIDWQFYDSQINFLNTDKEKELFEGIKSIYTKELRSSTKKALTITLNKAFDFDDESATAVKIAKDLMVNKDVALFDIVIVVSKIDDYKNKLEKYLIEYGLRGVVGKGKSFLDSPVYHELLNLDGEDSFKKYALKTQYKLDSLDDKFQEEYKLMVDCGLRIAARSLGVLSRLNKTNLDINTSYKELFTLFSKNAHYQSKSQANKLLVIEHNQVLRSEFEHIIYLGIDSTHLPQKFNDNFLYNSSNAKQLNISNYYEDATYIYQSLKENTANLHLVTAKYYKKRELQVSSIISDNFTSKLDEYILAKNVRSLNDLLDEKKQTTLGSKTASFIRSMQLVGRDNFHGIVGEDYNNTTSHGITFSASRLNTFSDCPLKYYFNYILKASSPKEFNDAEFDAAQAGTLFHSVVEVFAREFKGNNSLDIDIRVQEIYEEEYKKALPKKDGKIFETVFHKQKKQELQIAIDRFKKYVKNTELDKFDKAEEEFNFEMDGNKFTGIIDRIDIDESTSTVTLIDYKTSKAHKNTAKQDSKYQKLTEYKEFQLPLYQFFVDQDKKYSKYENSESYLLTFSGKMPSVKKKEATNARFGQTSSSVEDEKNQIFLLDSSAKVKYKEEISKIADNINNGNFYFNSCEDSCKYCAYLTLCGNGKKVEKKW